MLTELLASGIKPVVNPKLLLLHPLQNETNGYILVVGLGIHRESLEHMSSYLGLVDVPLSFKELL